MAYNKIEANGETLIDLTSDTVTADTLLSGRTAHLASGEKVTGTFEPVTGVKGNAESSYRKGNVNLTPANIGAATSAQGTKADSAVQTIQIGGTTQTKTNGTVNLPAYPTKSSLRLGNVDNTSDADKPVSTAMQTALDDIQEQIDYNTNNGVKNLLKINIPEKTFRGLTFTPQSDGTIIINGTANTTSAALVYYNLENPSGTTIPTQHSLNKIGYGNFIMSLNGDEALMAGIYLQILYYDTIIKNPPVNAQVSIGESKSITIDEDKKYVWFRLIIDKSINGKTFDNFVLKPMIRDASIVDNTFQPHAEPNYKLTQKVDKALEQTGYNLLPITIESQTRNGVTFTVDKANGTITANGTHTGTTASIISEYINLPAGTYSYTNSGDVETRDSTGDSLIQLNNTTIARGNVNDSPGNIFKLDSDSSIRVSFRTSAGYNPSNYIFKPMIVPIELDGVPFQPYAKSNAELTRYTDYVEISQDEDNHTDIISIGATKQLDIVHSDYFLQNKIILKGPNVYLPSSAEIVTGGQQAEISLATGAAEVKLVANTDSSNMPYLYLQSGVIPYISIQPNSNKMQFITDANGTQKIAIDTNGVHIASGGTVFEVKSDGVYINGTKIGG